MGWWSIAVSDDWQPKKLFCPHCGKPYIYDGGDSASIK